MPAAKKQLIRKLTLKAVRGCAVQLRAIVPMPFQSSANNAGACRWALLRASQAGGRISGVFDTAYLWHSAVFDRTARRQLTAPRVL